MRSYACSGAVAVVMMVAAVLLIAGCGGGGGKKKSKLVQSVAETRAYYQVVDLSSGTVTATGAIADLATNAAYRQTKMVFRLVASGSATLGASSGGFGVDADETPRSVSMNNYYIAVYETTQQQWNLLGGGSPWTTLASANPADIQDAHGRYPAIGIAYDSAQMTLASYNSGRSFRLRLPTEDEWEYACRGGSTGAFAWGDSLSQATVAANAIVWETAGATRGAREVGSLAANGLGLFDMHGNVWELCGGGIARGGSWNDPLSFARCANRAAEVIAPSPVQTQPAFETDLPHLLVGVRLVYVP
ncbi:MAG TPA: SUMF1/EgtB/PvdO family nonheme iron enzyme [Planctomycetota bacterium]|nr:SUMF1/EgtB/PvdO family nonheme iron enzyme [Planctomycetota bacterium]